MFYNATLVTPDQQHLATIPLPINPRFLAIPTVDGRICGTSLMAMDNRPSYRAMNEIFASDGGTLVEGEMLMLFARLGSAVHLDEEEAAVMYVLNPAPSAEVEEKAKESA